MSDCVPPHIEYLEGVLANSDASPERRGLAQEILASEEQLRRLGYCSPARERGLAQLEQHYVLLGPSVPRYVLPSLATNPEYVAAVMMIEAHLAAADLGLDLGEHLTAILYFAREPEARAMGIADRGDRAAGIAEAMLEAGRYTAQHLLGGDIGDVDDALGKLESAPCPCCGRPFGHTD
jgi:hypothetical protein